MLTVMVFVRDETSGGFHRAYKGPFRVVSKHAKFFTLDLGNRIDTVSVDRLKAANLLENVTDDVVWTVHSMAT